MPSNLGFAGISCQFALRILGGTAQTIAETPVTARPTMRVLISYEPS